METIKEIWKKIRKLLNRFGRKRRTGREILLSHNRSSKVLTAPHKPIDIKIDSEPEINVADKISENSPEDTVQKDISTDETSETDYTGKFVLNIKSVEEFENYKAKLQDLQSFDDFLSHHFLNWISVRIERVRNKIEGMDKFSDLSDPEINFHLAKLVRKVSESMLEIFHDSNINEELDEDSRNELKGLVNNYLQNLGVDEMNFKVGDLYHDWAELSMKSTSATMIETDDPTLPGKIAEIEIQPHRIYYMSEDGEVENLTFGGLCKAYMDKKDAEYQKEEG